MATKSTKTLESANKIADQITNRIFWFSSALIGFSLLVFKNGLIGTGKIDHLLLWSSCLLLCLAILFGIFTHIFEHRAMLASYNGAKAKIKKWNICASYGQYTALFFLIAGIGALASLAFLHFPSK